MSDFQELIKNFEKIRDYSRDFLIYGYKTRNNFNTKSKRTYDNEKRRIESFLFNYVKSGKDEKGKRVFISINPNKMIINPFFCLWETKHFTNNDCLLHFVLTEIIRSKGSVSLDEAYDILVDDYLYSEHISIMDIMTVRNKLNEYVKIGYFQSLKIGKKLFYSIKSNEFDGLNENEIRDIDQALSFFSNIKPFGQLGYLLKKKLESNTSNSIMKYKDYFVFHTLDDEVLLDVIRTIDNKSEANFDVIDRNNENVTIKGTALKILSNNKHGRRYVVISDATTKNFYSLRLDKMKKVKELNTNNDFDLLLKELNELQCDS